MSHRVIPAVVFLLAVLHFSLLVAYSSAHSGPHISAPEADNTPSLSPAASEQQAAWAKHVALCEEFYGVDACQQQRDMLQHIQQAQQQQQQKQQQQESAEAQRRDDSERMRPTADFDEWEHELAMREQLRIMQRTDQQRQQRQQDADEEESMEAHRRYTSERTRPSEEDSDESDHERQMREQLRIIERNEQLRQQQQQRVYDEQQAEVRQVQATRMDQMAKRRQAAAAPATALTTRTPPQQRSYYYDEAEAVDELLAMLEAITSADDSMPSPHDAEVSSDCGSSAELSVTRADGVVLPQAAQEVEEAAEDEVVLLVASNAWGTSMIVALHQRIYHADHSHCTHFTPPAQQHTSRSTQQPAASMMPDAGFEAYQQAQLQPQFSPLSQAWASLPLVERVVAVVLLAVAALLCAATVVGACMVRAKRRQQRVLIEPPSVQQLGLDVPLVSSSPSSSVVLQL